MFPGVLGLKPGYSDVILMVCVSGWNRDKAKGRKFS